MTTNSPITLKQAYICGVRDYCLRQTKINLDKYTKLLATARFPASKKIAIRKTMKVIGYEDSSVNHWMSVFAELFDDPTIKELPLMPASVGTVIVPAGPTRNALTPNNPYLVYQVCGEFMGVNDASGTKAHSVYAEDQVRYANPDEVERFAASIGDNLLNGLKTSATYKDIHQYAENQMVNAPEPMPEEE